MPSAVDATTPDRATILQADIGEVTYKRLPWMHRRDAADIARGQQRGAALSSDVLLLPGSAWSLKPFHSEMAQVLRTEYSDAIMSLGDFNAAAQLAEVDMWRAPTDIPGMAVSGSVIASGAPAFQKRIPAGADAESALPGSQLALPPPPSPTEQIIPLDRVLEGTGIHPPNSGYILGFLVGNDWWGTDGFFTFYFGGGTEVRPLSESGGRFALSLHGNGEALLQEYREERDGNPAGWENRTAFEWAAGPKLSPGFHVISILPYGRDRIGFIVRSSGDSERKGGMYARLLDRGLNPHHRLYREVPSRSGHVHLTYMTGHGSVLADIRRDSRQLFSIARAKYPEDGLLVDEPFSTPNLPGGTPMTLVLDGYRLPGTSLAGAIFNADTHAALATDVLGRFLSVAGLQRYYVRVAFTPSADRFSTPVLFSYQVEAAGLTQALPNVPIVGSHITGLSITGPDIDIDHESANVQVSDLTNFWPIFRVRDGVRTIISVVDPDTLAVKSNLFEGETLEPLAGWRGNAGSVYPSAEWRDYRLRMVGLWSRLLQAHVLEPENFTVDEAAPEEPGFGKPPWKVTTVIRYCLAKAGVPDDEMSIPDLPFRLWATADMDKNTWSMNVGTEGGYARLAAKLCKDFLGGVLLRCPNSGARGMWRLIFPPALTSTNYLASFAAGNPPGGGPRLVTHPGAWGANTTFIRKGTFQTFPKKPEINDLEVAGVSPDGTLLKAYNRNEDSISNRASPHYVGHVRRYVRKADPALPTQEAVNFVARRIWDAAGYAQKRFEFVAPLWLGFDPLDSLQVLSRPLRLFDLAFVTGFPAVITSCNPDYRKDAHQMAFYEGYFRTPGLVV